MKSIIIAGTQSGSGKTTVTLGIMECLKRRGLRVAPFKVGPDFIDPGYHRLVTGRPSINLDGWMCSEIFVRDTFSRHAEGADIAVIEGVMGLFDGIGGKQEAGSTAQIAKIIGAPVILVVDAKSQARSAAALVRGFAEFDPKVRVAGVIFNNVGSDSHARILRDAVESLGMGIKVVGCLPRDERLHIPSRHLGLMTVEENPLPAEFLDCLVEIIWDNLDLGLLWAAGTPHGIEQSLPFSGQVYTFDSSVKGVDLTPVLIAVARDYAFCFMYEDNLRLLREAGAEIVEFSPLRDDGLPEGIAGIYLPGGYPELFAETLSGNVALKAGVHRVIKRGMPVYAECGGFIYLTKGVVADPWNSPRADARTENGEQPGPPLHDFVGTFPVTTRMLARRKALGYREVEFIADSILGPAGMVARGHEFHYSEMGEMPPRIKRSYRVSKNDVDLGTEGYRYKNCLASYV
ncbi:MAG TPA: cobyrinate a,c-diamide synthase, partial [Geobacteraceae bacterium]|nr:cobyrinate a,c-diamide synthase [Geobacteraceae bacterium]